jgi:hypothetical protein
MGLDCAFKVLVSLYREGRVELPRFQALLAGVDDETARIVWGFIKIIKEGGMEYVELEEKARKVIEILRRASVGVGNNGN